MNKAFHLMILATAGVLVFSGCRRSNPTPPTPPTPPKAARAPKAAKAPKPPPGTTVFSSFGDGGSYDKTVGWGIMAGLDGYRGQAEWFVPAASGKLEAITLAVTGNTAASKASISIAQDNKNIPGTILESFSDVSCPGNSGVRFPALVLASKTHPVLEAGVKYWVCVEPADVNSGCAWKYNNQNRASGFAAERLQGGWTFSPNGPRNGAFSVNVNTNQPGGG